MEEPALLVAVQGIVRGIEVENDLFGRCAMRMSSADLWTPGTERASIDAMVTLPFASIVTTYLYFDVRVREELEREAPAEGGVLPAEIPV